MSKEDVMACLRPDGGLYDGVWYLEWVYGSGHATLDGYFSAEDLRAIADVMDGRTTSAAEPAASFPRNEKRNER